MEDKDAALAQLREEVERLKAKLDRSHLYRNSSYWQEKAMAVLRGEFTQCCSYCGFEAQPPNGWEELQKHIEECPEHPLPKLRARLEAAEAAVGILQKSTVSLLARAEQAEKELAAERGKVEKQYELIDFYDAKVAAVMKWRESAYIPDDSDENELKRILLGE